MAEIDRILRQTIVEPVGPEFMAPQARSRDSGQQITRTLVAAKQD